MIVKKLFLAWKHDFLVTKTWPLYLVTELPRGMFNVCMYSAPLLIIAHSTLSLGRGENAERFN